MKYKVNDIVTLKKGHPCGENKWEILRTGADIKLKCLGCDKIVWLTRLEFNKRIRKIQDKTGKFVSIVHYEPEENDRRIMNYVVIPAYKPDEKLTKLVENLSENHLNIIVVKDGACDYDFSKLNNIVLLEHQTNMGKGAALKTAFKYLKSQQANGTVVTSDADGQHLVKDILKLIKFSEQNKDKLILGVRDLKRGIPIKSLLGNTITRMVFYSSSSKYIKDTQTGLRAFNTSNLDKMIEIEGDRYEYEMNMLYEFDSESIMQVPIETIYIENNETSHFNALKDSAKIYKSILKFSTSSYLSFLVDYFTFILLFYKLDVQSLVLSNIIARVVSSTFNFYVNNKYVFKNKDKILKKYIKYVTLVVFILALNTVVLKNLQALGIRVFVAKIITEALMFIVSYNIQKRIIFK